MTMRFALLITLSIGSQLAASALHAQEEAPAAIPRAEAESGRASESRAEPEPEQEPEAALEQSLETGEASNTEQEQVEDEPEVAAEEAEVELTDKAEAALDTIVFSSEDPEVARRARKQAEKEARYQQEREQAELEKEAPEAADSDRSTMGAMDDTEIEPGPEPAAEPDTKREALTQPGSELEPEPESIIEPEPKAEAATAPETQPRPEAPSEEAPVPGAVAEPVESAPIAPGSDAPPEPSPPAESAVTAQDTLPAATEPAAEDSPVETVEKVSEPGFEYELYASVRLHGINTFDLETEDTDNKLGDGASRIGAALYFETKSNWEFYGRLESGFDIIDTFTPKAQVDSNAKLPIRLAHLGVDSEYFNLKAGKSWSTYYKVAGAADLFMIFGASAMGIYNAGTDGGASGTGRADEALQTQVYVDLGRWIDFKPFNINLQYQWDQPIPKLEKENYSHIYSASTWFEHWRDIGVGLAYHRASVDDLNAQEVVAAGITGDAVARAVSFRTYGDKWLASFVAGRHENLETNDRGQYIDAEAYELFFQRQLSERIWLIGGGNWLLPDEDDPEAGEYKIAYGVLGARYTFDGLRRMVYAEWKSDHGRATDGTRLKNEFTIGVRWDFGY